MSASTPFRAGGGGGFGLTGPVPRDIWLLLGVLFGSFSLQFFAPLAWLPAALRLTPEVWRHGFLWQLVTYPFVGSGAPGFWFVLELIILLMFGRDVYRRLGRRGFWTLLVMAAVISAAAAVAVALIQVALGGSPQSLFALMQGQHFVIVVLIAAFATMNANATILLFFVLPIQARWFLLLEIVFAFMGFLGTGDLAGFVGLCVAVGAGVRLVGGRLAAGLPGRLGLRLRERWLRLRLAWLKRRRGLRVVRDDDDRGPDRWVH